MTLKATKIEKTYTIMDKISINDCYILDDKYYFKVERIEGSVAYGQCFSVEEYKGNKDINIFDGSFSVRSIVELSEVYSKKITSKEFYHERGNIIKLVQSILK